MPHFFYVEPESGGRNLRSERENSEHGMRINANLYRLFIGNAHLNTQCPRRCKLSLKNKTITRPRIPVSDTIECLSVRLFYFFCCALWY